MRRFPLLQLVGAGFAAFALQACDGRAAMPPAPLAVVQPVPLDGLAPETLTLPNSENSVKFAVIGDSGRGTQPQLDVAAQMARFHDRFAFPFVIMVGDNLYEGPATPDDYRVKFEEPYAELTTETTLSVAMSSGVRTTAATRKS